MGKDAFRPNSTVIQFVRQRQIKHSTKTGRILLFRRYHTSCRIWSVRNRMRQLLIKLNCNNILRECQIDKTDKLSVRTNRIDFRTQYWTNPKSLCSWTDRMKWVVWALTNSVRLSSWQAQMSRSLQSKSSQVTVLARLHHSLRLKTRTFRALCQPTIHSSKFPYLSQVANQAVVRLRVVSSLRRIPPFRGHPTSYMASTKAVSNLHSSKDRYSSNLRLRCAHLTKLSPKTCPRPLWRIDAASR